MSSRKKPIKLGAALIPVVFLILALSVTIIVLKEDPHIPLILAATVAAIVAVVHKHSWKEIQDGMVHGISLAMGAILILMVVGLLIGTWISGGIVPSMIFYGLKILSPGIFLIATLIICSIVSLGTGSSWSTAGTVGVALIGVGQGLGIPVAMVAGAIVSGAYFGDKLSPLSDTTNLAPAVAGADLFSHIRHMVYTTVPGYVLSIILYGIIGMRFSGGSMESGRIDTIVSTLGSNFTIHPILLLPPLLVIVMVVKKIPPLPAILGGTFLGGFFGMVMQGRSLADVIIAAKSGFVSKTGVIIVDDLLTRGGLDSMLNTVALIMCASFEEHGLHPKNLSRALEDSGTLTSPLIPWNSCGAFMGATLGVSPLLYLPFAFLNLANPLVSLFYGYTGITMEKLPPDERAKDSQSG
jgi:NhaC family Na+:H+ antiporter